MEVLNSVMVKKTMLLYSILREGKSPLYGLGTVHKSDKGSDCTCPGRKVENDSNEIKDTEIEKYKLGMRRDGAGLKCKVKSAFSSLRTIR